MHYDIKPLTLQDIREVSTNYLNACINNFFRTGEGDIHVISMMYDELYERKRWRRINA